MFRDFAWTAFPPALFLMGVVYHLHHFPRFKTKKMRSENLYIFFIVLTVMDLLALCIPLLNDWLKEMDITNIRTLSTTACQAHVWLSGVVLDVPPWLLVLISYEKRAFLWYPVPADSQFSRPTLKLAILGVILLFGVRNVDMVSYIVHTHTKHKNSSAGNGSAKEFQEEFCDLNHSASAVFLELLLPWLDFLLRVLSPFACLTTYNAFILRKIWREDRCAQRLMDKVGIVAPLWFHVGLLQARHTVRRTSLLTASMFLCGLLLSLYSISRSIRGTDLSEKHHPTWRLLAVLTFYLNYSCLYPAYAIQDHSLLIAMRDTWRNPLVRKRGTTVASAAPKITSSSDQPSTSTTALCLLEWFCGSPEDMSQSKSVSGSPSAFTSKSMREKPLQQKSSGHLFPSKSKSQCTLHESESESESEFTGGK